MYLTEREIMSQHEALIRTCSYMEEEKEKICAFFEEHNLHSFVFMGCGSSYMLAKSGSRLMQQYPGTDAVAIAGGDYLVSPKPYEEMIRKSIVIVLSRSGKTTEIVRDVRDIKERFHSPVISISMLDQNDVMPMADLNLTLNWCYDESVCQTRTVTNLYTVLLMLVAFYGGDEELVRLTKCAAAANEVYKNTYRPALKEMAAKDWTEALVLADGVTEGIAEEGSLAYAEISMLPGQYSHLLDFRHGPMVLYSEKTLTLILVQPDGRDLQEAMIGDLKKKGGKIITMSEQEGNPYETDLHVTIPGECAGRVETWGIFFIFIMQMTAYEKALLRGTNPDLPVGLDAYITLK